MTTGDDAAESRPHGRRDDYARIDARLQEIHARWVLHDGRFAAFGDRVNQTDRRFDALSARIDSRMRAVDGRFTSIELRLDAVLSEVLALAADRSHNRRRRWGRRR